MQIMEPKEPAPNPILKDVSVVYEDDHICVMVKPEGATLLLLSLLLLSSLQRHVQRSVGSVVVAAAIVFFATTLAIATKCWKGLFSACGCMWCVAILQGRRSTMCNIQISLFLLSCTPGRQFTPYHLCPRARGRSLS